MKQIKKRIVDIFLKEYGFAPALKDIRPLEASSCQGYEVLGFHVNGIGYVYRDNKVTRAKQYDL